MRIFFLAIILVVSLMPAVQAQKALRYDKFLEKKDFDKFLDKLGKQFEKSSNDPANTYMLARYLSLQDSSTRKTDSALQVLTLAKVQYDDLSQDLKLKYQKKGLDSVQFGQLWLRIDSIAFKQAKRLNTEYSYNKFIRDYPNRNFHDQAIQLRNNVAYKAALLKNTPEALEGFYSKYPNAEQAKSAKDVYETLFYENKTRSKSLDSYIEYLNTKPQGAYSDVARERIFSILYVSSKPKELNKFLNSYPQYLTKSAKTFIRSVNQSSYSSQYLHYQKDNQLYWYNINENELIKISASLAMDSVCQFTHQNFALSTQFQSENLLLPFHTNDTLHVSNATSMSNGFIKYRNPQSTHYSLYHPDLNLPFNQFLDIIELNGFLFATKSDEGYSLISPLGKVLTREHYDSIWFQSDILFFEKEGSYAILPGSELSIKTLEDFLGINTIYTAYEWLNDNLLLKSTNHQTLLSDNGDILIPFSRAEISQQDSYWVAAGMDQKYTFYDDNFNFLLETQCTDYKTDNSLLAIQKDSLWALATKSDQFFLDFKYDSVRFFQSWLTYAESDDKKYLQVDTASLELTENENFTLLKDYSFSNSDNNGDNQFLVIRNENNYSKLYNNKAVLIHEGLQVEYAIVAAGILKVEQEGRTYLIGADGQQFYFDKKAKAIGKANRGVIPVLTREGFQAFNITLKKTHYINSDKIPNDNLMDSLYIVNKENAFGLVSSSGVPILDFKYQSISKLNDSIVYVRTNSGPEGRLFNALSRSFILNGVFYLEPIELDDERYFLIRMNSGFGLLNERLETIIDYAFNLIELKIINQNAYWYAERTIDPFQYVVLGLFDRRGEILHRVGLSKEDYAKTLCD